MVPADLRREGKGKVSLVGMLVVVLVMMMALPLMRVLVRSGAEFLPFAVSPTIHLQY